MRLSQRQKIRTSNTIGRVIPVSACVVSAAVCSLTLVCPPGQGAESHVRTHWQYVAKDGAEPSDVSATGLLSSRLGAATFPNGSAPPLRTADTSPTADGRYYYNPGDAVEFNDQSELRLEVSLRVLRSSGHPCATTVQIPLDGGKAELGPLRLGGHGEGYQEISGHGDLWVAMGFIVDEEDHEKDEVLLVDMGGAAGRQVVGRCRVPVNVMRNYLLEVRRGKPGVDDDVVRLSLPGTNLEPLSVRVADLKPVGSSGDFGFLFGHPVGGGMGEAEWERLALTISGPPRTRPAAAAPADTSPRRIAGRRQLFLDDWLIEKLDNLTRRQGQPEKHPKNPVFRRERPWEAARCELYGSAVWDPDNKRLQLFYSSMSKPYDTKMAYADSIDGGLTWMRPLLDVFLFDAQKTNIVWPGRYYVAGPSVFRDTHDPDPARRYKLFTSDYPTGDAPEDKGARGIDVGFSPDGIHWTASKKNPVIPGFVSDTTQSAFWDSNVNKYVAYVRLRSGGRRSVGRVESDDFETWTQPRVIYVPTPADSRRGWQYYSLAVTPYEGVYVGLVWIFPATAASADSSADTPVTWPELVTSRDGLDWRRVFFGEPFLPLGPPGSFDRRQIRTASSLVVLEDRILLVYSGSPHAHVAAHKFDIGLATLRTDGFASLNAGEQEGTMLSGPLCFEAGSLKINAVTEADGYVKAELLDASGSPLAGYEADSCRAFQGDSLSAKLTWKEKAAVPPAANHGTRIRFLMKNAMLYSFRIDGEGG